MKTAVFSTKPYDTKFLVAANVNATHEFDFYEEKLSPHTAKLAEGNAAICAFVNDVLNARVLDILQSQKIRMIALRCAGFNQVDLRHASALGIKVAHVSAYSPYTVAEFALIRSMASTAGFTGPPTACATVISRSTVFLALTSRERQ